MDVIVLSMEESHTSAFSSVALHSISPIATASAFSSAVLKLLEFASELPYWASGESSPHAFSFPVLKIDILSSCVFVTDV